LRLLDSARAKGEANMPPLAQNPPQAGAGIPAILTKQQAAEYLQVTPRYIERAAASGRLRVFKPSAGVWRVSLRDIEAFLNSGASIA
jgi:excisionase family DNA binding protein